MGEVTNTASVLKFTFYYCFCCTGFNKFKKRTMRDTILSQVHWKLWWKLWYYSGYNEILTSSRERHCTFQISKSWCILNLSILCILNCLSTPKRKIRCPQNLTGLKFYCYRPKDIHWINAVKSNDWMITVYLTAKSPCMLPHKLDHVIVHFVEMQKQCSYNTWKKIKKQLKFRPK